MEVLACAGADGLVLSIETLYAAATTPGSSPGMRPFHPAA